MPTATERIVKLREATPEGEIPYISKSRLLKFVKCPEQFRYSYIKGLKEPETTAMARGTSIHTAFEDYYDNVAEHVAETGEFPEDLASFLPDATTWADYVEPYISNFLVFEYDRWDTVNENLPGLSLESRLQTWLPVEVEAEAWLEDPIEGLDSPPWMGFADAIYWSDSVPGIENPDGGVVICDHKTGKTPSVLV